MKPKILYNCNYWGFVNFLAVSLNYLEVFWVLPRYEHTIWINVSDALQQSIFSAFNVLLIVNSYKYLNKTTDQFLKQTLISALTHFKIRFKCFITRQDFCFMSEISQTSVSKLKRYIWYCMWESLLPDSGTTYV